MRIWVAGCQVFACVQQQPAARRSREFDVHAMATLWPVIHTRQNWDPMLWLLLDSWGWPLQALDVTESARAHSYY